MITSNAAVQTSKTEAQKGFSLIELLVVVAIIGVLAAAGIVGYQSYLDNVKNDTHKNNALSMQKALKLALIATDAGISGSVDACKASVLDPKPPLPAVSGADGLALDCVVEVLGGSTKANAEWKSPFNAKYTGTTAVNAGTGVGPYLVSGTNCAAGTGGQIVIGWAERGNAADEKAKIIIKACNNADSPAVIAGADLTSDVGSN